MSAAFFDLMRNVLTAQYLRVNDRSTSRERVNLRERVRLEDGKRKEYTVRMPFEGDAFTVKLDINGGSNPPLYHFLMENDGRPWAKRCDFVVFHRLPSAIYCYLFEFKSNYINAVDIAAQLDSGVGWLNSFHRILHNYTSETFPLAVQKFALTANRDLGPFVDETGKYLKHDPTVRLYHYQELTDLNLADLENRHVMEFRCQ
ncbi:hypothetical protein [Sphingobium baderi]|uniref:hypothetical protein n=1 Tax=Sphingobium baderi TaxID=1332080 RepID=UPI002B413DAC|nr:hypothetical protein [Sphingobium baderi]WRD77809.1 hypothetical protein QQ987_06845 [Sphingobium baderi]